MESCYPFKQRVRSTITLQSTINLYLLYLPFFYETVEKFNFKNYTHDSKIQFLSINCLIVRIEIIMITIEIDE